jgi:mono/diheme cytochrome c family protein
VTGRGLAAAVIAVAAAIGAIVGWGTASTRDASRAVAGDSLSGATLFRTKGCASCHNGPETEAIVGIGPDLSDAASWAGDRRPAMTAEDYVAESVRTPGAFISPAFEPIGGPTDAMPQLDVSDAELDAVVSYLLGS